MAIAKLHNTNEDVGVDIQHCVGGLTCGFSDLQPPNSENRDIQRIPWKVIVSSMLICLGSFNFGTVTTYTSPAMNDLNSHPNPFFVDSNQNSWVGSIISLGALVGGLIVGSYMDLIGRKLTVMTAAVPLAVGWAIVVGSPSFACLLVGRVLTGFGMGIYSGVCPVYITEIAPPSIRGFLGSCPQLAIVLGILYTYGFGAFLSWQWLGVTCGAVLVVLMIAVSFIPDSPRWCLSVGKVDEAKYALQWLRGIDSDVDDELKELHKIVKETSDKASLKEFLHLNLLKPLMVAVGLMLFQQFSGINVVLFYTVDIFKMAHIDMDPNLQSIIVGVAGVVGTAVSIFVIDLAGRKILLFVSSIVMTLSIGSLGAFFFVLDDPKHSDYATTTLFWLPVTCLVVFYFGYNLAFGGIPWLMMGELFPLRAKGHASSIVTACSYLFAFFGSKFFVDIIDGIGRAGTFWLFTGICALSIPFVVICVPETKGKTLEEITAGFQ